MSIRDLYSNFEITRACEMLSHPEDSRTGMLCQLVAFNMLQAWVLWPEDKAESQARRAARVTARWFMTQFQLPAESGYIRARQGGDTEIEHQNASTIGHFIGIFLRNALKADYATFLDEIVLPLGGSRLVYKTTSDASFRRHIDEHWEKVQFVALMVDILIRHAAEKTPYKTSSNRAIYFIEEGGCVPTKTKNRSDLYSLWKAYKSKAPIIYALWKASPETFLLHKSMHPSNKIKSLRKSLQRARHVLEEASWAKGCLLEIPNVVKADPRFVDLSVNGSLPSQAAEFSATPLSDSERALLRQYRAPKQS